LLVPNRLAVRDRIWGKNGTEAVVAEVKTAWKESASWKESVWEAALPGKT